MIFYLEGYGTNYASYSLLLASIRLALDWPPESPDNQYHLNK